MLSEKEKKIRRLISDFYAVGKTISYREAREIIESGGYKEYREKNEEKVKDRMVSNSKLREIVLEHYGLRESEVNLEFLRYFGDVVVEITQK